MAEKAMSDPMAMAGNLKFWWIVGEEKSVRVIKNGFSLCKYNKKEMETEKFKRVLYLHYCFGDYVYVCKSLKA